METEMQERTTKASSAYVAPHPLNVDLSIIRFEDRSLSNSMPIYPELERSLL